MELMNLTLHSTSTDEKATMTVEVDCDIPHFFMKIEEASQGEVTGILEPIPQRENIPLEWKGIFLSRFF